MSVLYTYMSDLSNNNTNWIHEIGENLIESMEITIDGISIYKPKSQMLKDLEAEGYQLNVDGFCYVGKTKNWEEMIGSNKIIKSIGILHNYCCKEDYFEIYYVPLNKITNELEILLLNYTNDSIDIMENNPFYDLLRICDKCEQGNVNTYNNCDYKLYSQDC